MIHPGYRPFFYRPFFVVSTAVASLLITGHPAQAINFTFTNVADSTTLIPGRNETFDLFYDPALNGSNLAFIAGTLEQTSGFTAMGVYSVIDGNLGVVADRNTQIPGSSLPFTDFLYPTSSYPSISGETVVFEGFHLSPDEDFPMELGIYRGTAGGSLQTLVDQGTPLPGSSLPFYGFADPQISEETVVFYGFGYLFENGSLIPTEGIYTLADGKMKALVSQETPIPHAVGTFESIDLPSISQRNVAFRGGSEAFERSGIYASIDGELRVIADNRTPLPDNSGNPFSFFDFSSPTISGENVVFGSLNPAQEGGIYAYLDGQLEVIAQTNTPTPDGIGRLGFDFTERPGIAMDGENVAFVAYDVGNPNPFVSGIYTNLGGSLSKVIATGDQLDGKTVVGVGSGGGLNPQAMSGNAIAFPVSFNDGSAGIYIAQAVADTEEIPEPRLLLGLLAVVGWGMITGRLRLDQRLSD